MRKKLLKFLLITSSIFAFTITSYAEYQSNSGFPEASPPGTQAPPGVDGSMDGMQGDINNTSPPRDDCSKPNVVGGTAGMEDSGREAGGSSGSAIQTDTGKESTETATGEVSGETNNSSSSSTSTTTPDTSEEKNNPGSNTSGSNSSNTNNSNGGNSDSGTGSGNGGNSGSNSTGTGTNTGISNPPPSSLEELLRPGLDANNAYKGYQDHKNNSGNNTITGKPYDEGNGLSFVDADGNSYSVITGGDFINKGTFTDGNYELVLNDGTKVTMVLEQDENGKWFSKTTTINNRSEGNRIYGSESEWYKIHEVLEYGYWDWKNTTNADWIRYYGDKFYPISGYAETSKTPGRTSIKWTLGHGPYDDGKWLVRMTPFYTETWERSYQIEVEVTDCSTNSDGDTDCDTSIEIETRYEHDVRHNVPHEPTFYNVTVPLVCDECPEVILCLGDSPDCDCNDLNTKCDDENDPELTIEHRVELDN